MQIAWKGLDCKVFVRKGASQDEIFEKRLRVFYNSIKEKEASVQEEKQQEQEVALAPGPETDLGETDSIAKASSLGRGEEDKRGREAGRRGAPNHDSEMVRSGTSRRSSRPNLGGECSTWNNGHQYIRS